MNSIGLPIFFLRILLAMTKLRNFLIFSLVLFGLAACTSMDKLQARLEANPQCPPVVNPKTGALMPCPSLPNVQTEASKPQKTSSPNTSAQTPVTSMAEEAQVSKEGNLPGVKIGNSGPKTQSSSPSFSASPECKPVLHQKTGSLLPCPSP